MKTQKSKSKISGGQLLTIVSFVAVMSVAVIAMSRGRAQEKLIPVDYGSGPVESPAPLNEKYVNNPVRTKEFFEGAKCEQPNLDCFTTQNQPSQMLGWSGQILGTPDGTSINGSGTEVGLLQQTNRFIAMTFQPIASGTYFVADALDKIGVANTYAQGFGYYSLVPFLGLWRVFRNLAYVFFTVIIIVIGFMILFRQKIGNQAAVTAQQALPRIVVALLLVTFSYAIVGFLIDIMYWIMYAFASFTNLSNSNEIVNANFGALGDLVLSGSLKNAYSGISELTKQVLSGFTGNTLGGMLGWIGGVLGTLIVAIVMVVNLFWLLFVLLKSYATVLLNLVFAPMTLMLYAIPGVDTFKKWIMSIVANLSPFVVVFFMLIFVGTLQSGALGALNNQSVFTAQAQGWTPPYITGGVAGGKEIGTLVSLAIMLALPEIVEGVKKKLGGGEGFFGEIANAAMQNANKARQGRVFRGVTGAAAGAGIAGLGMIGAKVGAMRQGGGTGLRAKEARGAAEGLRLRRQQAIDTANKGQLQEMANREFGFQKADHKRFKTEAQLKTELQRRIDHDYDSTMAATSIGNRFRAATGLTGGMRGEAQAIWGKGIGGYNYADEKEKRKEVRRNYFKNYTKGSLWHYGFSGATKGAAGVAKQAIGETDFAQRFQNSVFTKNLQNRRLAQRIINEGSAGGWTPDQITNAQAYLNKYPTPGAAYSQAGQGI